MQIDVTVINGTELDYLVTYFNYFGQKAIQSSVILVAFIFGLFTILTLSQKEGQSEEQRAFLVFIFILLSFATVYIYVEYMNFSAIGSEYRGEINSRFKETNESLYNRTIEFETNETYRRICFTRFVKNKRCPGISIREIIGMTVWGLMLLYLLSNTSEKIRQWIITGPYGYKKIIAIIIVGGFLSICLILLCKCLLC